MRRPFESIIAEFQREAAVDFIGLWQLVRAVKNNLEQDDISGVQQLSLNLLKCMLAVGFRVGYLSGTGKTLEPWSDQQPDHVVTRVRSEWNALGREPNIGDIAWLDYKPSSWH
jgi:hypothetical protein